MIVLALGFAVAACSGAASPTGTPHPSWTNADSVACQSVALAALRWGDEISDTDRQMVTAVQPGDVATARKEVRAVTSPILADLRSQSAAACQPELGALENTMAAAVAAFGSAMTIDQYRSTYSSIDDSIRALGDKADEVQNWVEANVPQ